MSHLEPADGEERIPMSVNPVESTLAGWNAELMEALRVCNSLLNVMMERVAVLTSDKAELSEEVSKLRAEVHADAEATAKIHKESRYTQAVINGVKRFRSALTYGDFSVDASRELLFEALREYEASAK